MPATVGEATILLKRQKKAVTKMERRRSIVLAMIKSANAPISATTIAKETGVSRQIIVGDIALLRASGQNIMATPKGYIFHTPSLGREYHIACKHDYTETVKELYIIVDHGATVENVIVTHSIYGEITAQLSISSRSDVDKFMEQAVNSNALPLSCLTAGVHIHKIICPSEEIHQKILKKLDENGLLYK